jgi:pyruvate formate lyase activating enzyme
LWLSSDFRPAPGEGGSTGSIIGFDRSITGVARKIMSQARYWQPTSPQGDLVCVLCPHRCALRPGATGRCGARANVDGNLALLTWGRNAVVCIDPIEKKPLYHFLPGTPTLSFGGFGCNLSCSCCQNWELSRHRGAVDLPVQTPEEIAEAAVRKGCRSVAMTYNEPAVALEYASAVADACRARQIRPVGVSAGYVSEATSTSAIAARVSPRCWKPSPTGRAKPAPGSRSRRS